MSSQPGENLRAGLVKPNEVLSFSIVLGSFGVLFAAYLGSWALLTALLCVAMIIAYRAKLKKLERVSAAFVGGYIGLIFIYAGFAVGSPTWSLAIFAMMVFLSATGRETMRNLAEGVGNSSLGAGTETATEGYAAGGRQSGITFLAATAVSLLPVFRGLVSSSYIPLAVICDIGFLLTAFSVMTTPTPRNAKRNLKYVLIWISFGLLAFVSGTV